MLSVLGSLSFAQSSIPPYCAFYPNFEDDKKFDPAFGNFHHCLNGELQSFEFSEITSLMRVTHEATMDQAGEQFQKKLAEIALKKLLEKRKPYDGLYENFDYDISEDLKSCGVSARKPNEDNYNPNISKQIFDFKNRRLPKIDHEKKKDAVIFNLINSMRAKHLFKKNKDYKKKMEVVTLAEKAQGRKCVHINRRCKGNRKNCRNDYELCRKIQEDGAKMKREQLNKEIGELHKMVETSPFLFSNKETGNFLEGLQADDLAPSPLMEKMLNTIPSGIQDDFVKAMEKGNINAVDEFYQKNTETLAKLVNDPKTYDELSNAMQIENYQELKRLDEAARAICEQNGDTLHHFPELVNIAMDEYLNEATSREELRGRAAVAQASYCHLLNTQPDRAGKMSAATIGGLALLGIGGALQLVPIVGNVSGSGLIVVGTGLMTAGGLTLGAVGAVEGLNQTENLKQEVGLQSIGFTDYHRLIESKGGRDATYYGTAAEIPLAAVDIFGLRHLRHGKYFEKLKPKKAKTDEISRRVNIERRQMLDDMKDELGDEKFKHFLEKYIGDTADDMSVPDQIYITSMADLIEEKLKRRQPPLSSSELDKQAREVLESVVNKCGPYGKK